MQKGPKAQHGGRPRHHRSKGVKRGLGKHLETESTDRKEETISLKTDGSFLKSWLLLITKALKHARRAENQEKKRGVLL